MLRSSSTLAVILTAGAGAAGSVSAAEIERQFVETGWRAEVVTVVPGQDRTEIARRAGADHSIVVAAGGDGTVRDVVNGIDGTDAILGIIPLGTRNHFAKDLGLPLDAGKAVAAITAGRIGNVDVGEVNDRLFVNNSSIGLYPDIIEARDALQREGRGRWPAMARATARVLRRDRELVVRIETNGAARVWQTPFLFVGNNEYTIDGIHLGHRERLDGGHLFAYVTPRVHTHELPLLLAKALAGRAARSGAFEVVASTELTVEPSGGHQIRVALDGDVSMMTTPLRFRIRAGGLRVIVP